MKKNLILLAISSASLAQKVNSAVIQTTVVPKPATNTTKPTTTTNTTTSQTSTGGSSSTTAQSTSGGGVTTNTNASGTSSTNTSKAATTSTTNTASQLSSSSTTQTSGSTASTSQQQQTKSSNIPSITQDQFELRFGNRYRYNKPGNFLGYNPNKPFIPPLSKTTQVLSDYDKNFLLLSQGQSVISSFIYMYIQGIFTGLSASGYFYGTPQAVGNQIYPRGLNKYYDLYSVNGFIQFYFDYLGALLLSFISLSGLQMNLIIPILSGKSWDNILSIVYETGLFQFINFGAWWGIPLEGMMQLGW